MKIAQFSLLFWTLLHTDEKIVNFFRSVYTRVTDNNCRKIGGMKFWYQLRILLISGSEVGVFSVIFCRSIFTFWCKILNMPLQGPTQGTPKVSQISKETLAFNLHFDNSSCNLCKWLFRWRSSQPFCSQKSHSHGNPSWRQNSASLSALRAAKQLCRTHHYKSFVWQQKETKTPKDLE